MDEKLDQDFEKIDKKVDQEEKEIEEIVEKGLNPWKITCIFLAVLLGISLFTGGFTKWFDSDINGMSVADGDITATVINDVRCTECGNAAIQITEQLKTMIPNLKVETLDYNSDEGKELYDKHGLSVLPSFLFTSNVKEAESYAEIERYFINKSGLLELQIGADFNPTKEICDNGKDDTGNGNIDCADDDCKGEWQCMEKTDVPVVELFVMSHCPYGTQMEKGLLPVAKLLDGKADIQFKFVDYAMHGKKEIDEQLNQYCIQEEYEDLYLDYLECFLGTTAGDASEGKACMKELDIDEDTIADCVEDVDSEYGIYADYEDKSTWSGSFPSFSLYADENEKYGVQGSPHLVINGVEPSIGRDSSSILNAICLAFTEKPSECDTEVDSASPAPGFGWEGTSSGTTATCG